MLVVFIIVSLILLESVRRGMKDVLIMEYQYKMFALRDELRAYAIENPALAKGWVFMYLDSTLTKVVTVLPQITIWKTLALTLTHKDDYRFKVHRNHLEREYQKPANAKFKQIEVKIMATMGQFVVRRHSGLTLSLELLRRLSVSVVAMRSSLAWLRAQRKASLVVVVEAPETSTLGEYCPV
jgi:hypothetical protein